MIWKGGVSVNTIGKKIKEKREQIGMSQDELAEKMGYKSRSTIAKIESGVNDVVQSNIVKFANILNTTPAQLLGWEQDTIESVSEVQNDADAYDDEHEKELNDFMNELGSEFDFKQFERIKKYANALKSAMNVNIESFDELHQSYVELFQKMYELNLSEAELNDVYRYACFIKSKR